MGSEPRRIRLDTRKMPIGLERSRTRSLLLDATEMLMINEGYAAVTTRRLGAAAELKPQLVHYYFPSLEDLFVAVFRRQAERHLQKIEEMLGSSDPIRTLWKLSRQRAVTGVGAEFSALARHRKALQAEVQTFGKQLREMQLKVLEKRFENAPGCSQSELKALILLLSGVGLMLVLEENNGLTLGHAEVEAYVGAIIADFERRSAETPSVDLAVKTKRAPKAPIKAKAAKSG